MQVPPQTIDQGNVRFDVLMARMTAVQVRGDAGSSEGLLQKYIEKLASQPVFNINTVDRYLLLARDIPGLDVRLSLRPVSAESGGGGGDFTYAWTKPEIPGGFDARSGTLVASAYATYPFIRKQTRNIFGTVGLDYIDQRTDILGIRTNEDRLSVAYARLDFNQIEASSISGRGGYSAFNPKWGIGGSVEIRQGLDILGASQGCGPAFVNCLGQTVIPTRADGDPTVFVIRTQVKIDFRSTSLLAFTLKPRLQYSPDALFSTKKFPAAIIRRAEAMIRERSSATMAMARRRRSVTGRCSRRRRRRGKGRGRA